MIDFPKIDHIYICSEPVDGRKRIPGLSSIVLTYHHDPAENSAYAFISKSRKNMKVLYHDATGFVLYEKKLTTGCFDIDFKEKGMIEIDSEQLNWEMQGLSIYQWSSSKHKVMF